MTAALDKFGRILIPKKIRQLLGIDSETRLRIWGDGNKIIIETLPDEEVFVTKDGMLVFNGELPVEFDDFLRKDRADRDSKML